jgi:hypothetical protein
MEEALLAYLLAQSGVSSLVGTRAHWGKRPQGEALPGFVMQVISRTPSYVYEGGSDLAEARVQIDCYGANYKAARLLARAVRAPLDGVRFTQSSIRFEAFSLSERDLNEAGTTDAERTFRVSMDFQIYHQE